jgi:hypothetical protein
MKIRNVMLVGVALLMGGSAFAQEYAKWEIPVDYTYVRANPSRFGNNRSLNGGGGSVVYNFNRFFGIRGDLQGYGSTNATFTIPVGTPALPAGGTITTQGNLFTYMAGPQLRLPTHTFKPFADFLFGGAHSNLYANLNKATGSTGASPSNNAFAMAVGGGIDIRLSKTIYLRPIEVDYLLTRFGSTALGLNGVNQNNFRYQAGIVFAFGE